MSYNVTADVENFLDSIIDKGRRALKRGEDIFYDSSLSDNTNLAIFAILNFYQSVCYLSNFGFKKSVYVHLDTGKGKFKKEMDYETLFSVNNLFKNCLSKGNQIIALPVSIPEHANVLIYKVKTNTFEYLEPHGDFFMGDSRYGDKIDSLVMEIINYLVKEETIEKNITFKPSDLTCPNIHTFNKRGLGFQIYQEEEEECKISRRIEEGTCQIWALFYMELALRYPRYETKTLLNVSLEYLSEIKCGFTKLLLGYIRLLEDIISRLFEVSDFTFSKMQDSYYSSIIMEKFNRKFLEAQKFPGALTYESISHSLGTCILDNVNIDIDKYFSESINNIVIYLDNKKDEYFCSKRPDWLRNFGKFFLQTLYNARTGKMEYTMQIYYKIFSKLYVSEEDYLLIENNKFRFYKFVQTIFISEKNAYIGYIVPYSIEDFNNVKVESIEVIKPTFSNYYDREKFNKSNTETLNIANSLANVKVSDRFKYFDD